MATLTISITDGTTSVTFGSAATDYMIQSWPPSVARRADPAFNNMYEDVRETIDIFIKDTTASATLGNFETLQKLLDQARRWSMGETVDPVTLNVQMYSGGTTWKSIIKEGSLVLPDTFLATSAQNNSGSRAVVIDLIRCGMWLDGSAQSIGAIASSANYNPGIITGTWSASAALPSPTELSLVFNDQDTSFKGYILVSDVKDGSEKGIVIGNFDDSSTTDSNAYSGDLYRVTASASETTIDNDASLLTTATDDNRVWSLFAMLKNNSSSAETYTVKGSVKDSGGVYTPSTAPVIVEPGEQGVYSLGTVSLSGGTLLQRLSLTVSAAPGTNTGAGDALDIDYMAAIAIDAAGSYIWYVQPDSDYAVSGSGFTIESFHDPLTDRYADIRMLDETPTSITKSPLAYSGNAAMHTSGDTLYILPLLWTTDQFNFYTAGAKVTIGLNYAYRRQAAFIPN